MLRGLSGPWCQSPIAPGRLMDMVLSKDAFAARPRPFGQGRTVEISLKTLSFQGRNWCRREQWFCRRNLNLKRWLRGCQVLSVLFRRLPLSRFL